MWRIIMATDNIINEYAPDAVSPPGETLKELLQEREMSQAELARRTGATLLICNNI